jgi:hypothetical protein
MCDMAIYKVVKTWAVAADSLSEAVLMTTTRAHDDVEVTRYDQEVILKTALNSIKNGIVKVT